jgi:2-polyprenyl-3-methyl-5-hydroxy-6-metoxy-1,4-benzoquinol methylase
MEDKCLLCGSENKKIFLKTYDKFNTEDKYLYKKCVKCGLVALDERIDNKEFYTYNRLKKLSKAHLFVLWMFYNRLRKFKKRGDILDFGCGSGNLAKFLSNKGYNVDCLEVDETAIEWVKEFHKLPITRSILDKKYDAILLDGVLEHLPDPIFELNNIREHLKENGIVIITVPNINSFQAKIFKGEWFHLDAPRHLNHFYKNSFKKMMHKANLKIIKKHYFNIHIDPTGWLWSWKRPKFKKSEEVKMPLIRLGLLLPLVYLTSLFKSTGYVMYVIKK